MLAGKGTVNGDAVNRYPSGSGLKIDVPSMIAIAVFDQHPAEAILREQFGSTPWRRVQTWIAVRLLPLLGAVGVLFLPANGTQLAAVATDETGTTKIGKFVVNHSFMIPLLVSTVVAVVTGLIIVQVVG